MIIIIFSGEMLISLSTPFGSLPLVEGFVLLLPVYSIATSIATEIAIDSISC